MTNILQNQKKSNFLKPFKEQALRDIQISIKEWNEFQEKQFFYKIFFKLGFCQIINIVIHNF